MIANWICSEFIVNTRTDLYKTEVNQFFTITWDPGEAAGRMSHKWIWVIAETEEKMSVSTCMYETEKANKNPRSQKIILGVKVWPQANMMDSHQWAHYTIRCQEAIKRALAALQVTLLCIALHRFFLQALQTSSIRPLLTILKPVIPFHTFMRLETGKGATIK